MKKIEGAGWFSRKNGTIQLALASVFDQVAGVIFCQFEKCLANHVPERDGTIEDVINEWSARLTVPCIKDFPFGHGPHHQYVLPIGGYIKLNATNPSIVINFNRVRS